MVKSELKAENPSTPQQHLATPAPAAAPDTVRRNSPLSIAAPALVISAFFLIWYLVTKFHLVADYNLPSPGTVLDAGKDEIRAGRLGNDIVASLFRVAIAFTISTVLGIPAGLALGGNPAARRAFVTMLNFFRFISPLAWIPFAILWFHIGDKPAVFLIFMSTFFPITLATMAAVANIPSIYFRVAKDYNYSGLALLTKVTFPAVMPQIITSLRVAFGIARVVIVAAEMV